VKSSNKEETGATPDVRRLTTNPSNPHDIKNFLSWKKKTLKQIIRTYSRGDV